MLQTLIYLFGILALLVLGIVSLALWIKEGNRPEGRIKSFKTRYTPSVWSPEQMDYCMQVLSRIWLERFPLKKRKVRRVIDNLDIEWSPRRWKRGDKIAAAEAVSPSKLKIWKGPKLRGGRHSMRYTALPEGFIQILVFNLEGKVLDHQTISEQFADTISDMQQALRGQTSNDKLVHE